MERSRKIQFWSVGVLTLALCGGAVFGMKYGIREDAAVIAAGTSDAGPAEEAWTRILLGEDGKAGGTVTICQGGFYRVSGTLEEGQLCVDAADGEEVVLCLAGVRIKNSSEAAVYIKNAERTTILLEEGTENILQSGERLEAGTGDDEAAEEAETGERADAENRKGSEEPDLESAESEEETEIGTPAKAAVYARDDLTITGEGTLEVYGCLHNGIHTTNHLSIDSGTIHVEAANAGIRGKDSVTITGGDFSIISGGDGIKSNDTTGEGYGQIRISGGTFQIESGGDGIQAETTLDISSGDFTITSGGGSEAAPDTADREAEGLFGHPGGGGRGMTPPDAARPERGGNRRGVSGERSEMPGSGMEEVPEATEEEDSMPSCKGLKSGVGMEISGGTFTIDACDDAVHSDGTVLVSDGALFIQSGDDGIHADTELTVAGGTVEVETCYEGLEASQIQIGDGEIRITSSDDGINANGGPNGWMGRGMGDREAVETAEEEMPNLCISGGTVLVDAGGDGLDSNGNLTILGGTVIVDGPSDNGNGALDSGSESGGRCEVHGGLVLAIGSSGMAESFEDGSRQASFSCRLPSAFQAGSVITVTDREGQVLCTHTAAKEGSSVVFSCPALTEGETVLLEVDGETQEIAI